MNRAALSSPLLSIRPLLLAIFSSCLLFLLVAGCSDSSPAEKAGPGEAVVRKAPGARKKVLLVDSYHWGYAWSDGIIRAACRVFGAGVLADGTVDDSGSRVRLRLVHMDTKRHRDEESKRTAALRARAVIESWRPDLVIAADDNAARYLVVPYLKDTDLPVVFCGVNWTASVYGFPCRNVTGMVEVSLEDQVVARLKPYAGGDRIGFIGPDVLTTRKEAENVRRILGYDLVEYYARDADDFMKGFKALQAGVDILLINTDGGLYRDRLSEILAFIHRNTRIPTGAMSDYMAPYALLTIGKVPGEQGEWAARTALEILAGTRPADIPLARNHKARIILNMHLAKRLGIIFPMELIDQAEFVEEGKGR